MNSMDNMKIARANFRKLSKMKRKDNEICKVLLDSQDLLTNEELIDEFIKTNDDNWKGCEIFKSNMQAIWKNKLDDLSKLSVEGVEATEDELKSLIDYYTEIIKSETMILDDDLMDKDFNAKQMVKFICDAMAVSGIIFGGEDDEK